MARKVEIAQATEAHELELAVRMRPRDVEEVRAGCGLDPAEAVRQSVAASQAAYTLLVEGHVLAIFGVALVAPELHGMDANLRVGNVWLLSSGPVDAYPFTFLRLSRPILHRLLERFDVLVNAIDARYEQAVRWARWMGFQVEEPVEFGPEGRPFHLVALRRS